MANRVSPFDPSIATVSGSGETQVEKSSTTKKKQRALLPAGFLEFPVYLVALAVV